MPVYSEAQLAELNGALSTVRARAAALVGRLLTFPFATAEGTEYARHGLSRRVTSMAHSLHRIFDELPPDLEGLPDQDQREEATVHIQSVAFHAYGCFDNTAHVWVAERGLKRADGRSLPPSLIGFSEKCQLVLRSLPEPLQSQLTSLRAWMTFLEAFRHPSAHRIPVYIPPFVVNMSHVEEYSRLEKAKALAAQARDWEAYLALHDKVQALIKFRPMTATAMSAKEMALFHPQMLADFATVEKWINLVLDALSAPADQA